MSGSSISSTELSRKFNWLVEQIRCSEEALAQAEKLASETEDSLPRVLSKLGLVSEARLARILAEHCGLPELPPAQVNPDEELFSRFNPRFLSSRWAVPLSRSGSVIRVGVADPTAEHLEEDLRFASGSAIELAVTTYSAIESSLDALLETLPENQPKSVAQGAFADESLDAVRDLASDAPVVRRVQRWISQAIESRASDIHFEPFETGLQVRYRIDGVLSEIDLAPRPMRDAIVSRLKIMAGLNIAERRLPQDGRIRVAVHGRDTDFRVSTAPTLFGESVVLRILDRQQVALDFAALGFDSDVISHLRDALARPYGIVLCTGPTGSGKTTTLYAGLKELNTNDRKILTVEDPVEYTLEGINQTNVKSLIGYTFATALRAFLRQDPDILMVGEIRDRETAEIAVQAALTGHLVLSTLHTNTAAAALTRLLDMGIDDYLLTSTLALIIGQRLVRKLCVKCRLPVEVLPEMTTRFNLPEDKSSISKAVGCVACGFTGYVGRTCILELFEITPATQRLILQHADARTLEEMAVSAGMRTMFKHGMEKVIAGETTLEEVLRVTRAT